MWAAKEALQLADSTVEGQRVQSTHNFLLDRVAVRRIYAEAHTRWLTACLLLGAEAEGTLNFLPMVVQAATRLVPRAAATPFTLPAVVVPQIVVEQLGQLMVRREHRGQEVPALAATVLEAEEVGGVEVVLMVPAVVAQVSPPAVWFHLVCLASQDTGLRV